MLGRQTRRALLAACAFLGLLACAPAAALAGTQSARSGAVSAKLSYQGPFVFASTEVLTIARDGHTVYDRTVTSPACSEGPEFDPDCSPTSRHSVHVVNLAPGGGRDVVVDLTAFGLCGACALEQVFSYDPTKRTYVKTEHIFDALLARLADLGHNGRYEFVSSDGSFVCKFTVCPNCGTPLEILAFGDRGFTKVTTRYPTLIANDAAKWLEFYRRHLRNGLGWIAAWAADEDSLGNAARVNAYLAGQLEANDLKGVPGYPGGHAFITALNAFLRRHGYLR
jgi:hypothetical protein